MFALTTFIYFRNLPVKMLTVKDCTLIKPLFCSKDANVVEVAKILRENKQRRIIIIDDKDAPIGIISTTDINNRVAAESKDASRLKAQEVMTSPIFLVCDISDSLDAIFKKMVEHESFFCPVTDHGKLYGILTYGELIKKLQESGK